MPIGLGSLKPNHRKTTSAQPADKAQTNNDDAARLLKQMEDKRNSDQCPFC